MTKMRRHTGGSSVTRIDLLKNEWAELCHTFRGQLSPAQVRALLARINERLAFNEWDLVEAGLIDEDTARACGVSAGNDRP